MATLRDDVLLEIFSRVADDVAALFRCTVACKPWRALVADPSFLRGRWREDARYPSALLVLFGLQRGAWMSGPPTFVRAPRSPLVPAGRCFSDSFGPSLVSLLDDAEPIVSRQGLLLMRLSPPGETGEYLAVCDMFTGKCDVLPPLKSVFFHIGASAILTDADYCSKEGQSSLSSSYSNSFKVLVIIENAENLYLSPYSFSSSESSWSRPKTSFDLIERHTNHSNAVVCRGKVHWLVWDISDICNLYTFELGNETIHFSLTKLLIPRDQLEFGFYNPPRLTVTLDGKLSLLSLHIRSLKLEIWSYQDQKESGDDGAEWLRTKVIKLNPKMLRINDLSSTCLGERSGTFIILDRYKLVYIVDLETGAIDKVPRQFCTLRYNVLVPFEMDWPAFFMSRLEAKTK